MTVAIGERIKKLVGIEGDAKETLVPMVNYASKNIGDAAASQFIGDFYFLFLTKIEGLSTGLATVMSFLRSIWDAVIDPFIGFAVDRTRSRLGKHRFWVILVAVPCGVTLALRFTSFGLSGREGTAGRLVAYHLCIGLAYALFQSILDISHSSMLPTLAPGYFQRTQYTSMQYIMNSVGMGPAQIFGSLMIGLRVTRVFDASMRPLMLKMALIIGLAGIVPILYSGLATKERSSKNDVFPPLNIKAFFHEFSLVFKNRAFRQYFSMTFLYLFGSSFFGVSKPFFLDEVARRWDLKSQLDIWRGIAEMLMFPVNYGLTKKFGKQKCALLTLPMLFVSFLLGFAIKPQAAGSKLLSVAVMLFVREITYIIGYSGYGFMISNIYPDITDVDEMITGRRREATISTFNSFIKTMTGGFMASVVGVLLEWFGVAQESTKVPLFGARAKNLYGGFTPSFGLKLSNAFLPIVFLGLALVSLRKYKMTREDHELISRVIAQKHEAGAAEATEEERAKLEEIAGKPWSEMWVGC
ncbi:MAG: MFS transporter [Firmicutes bacterium]|nr:MFS transporter [Bacillota bacterium]